MLQKFLLTTLLIIPSVLSAQNVQLHYTPRHAYAPDDFSGNTLFTTVEMFKQDRWGSTFLFVDMTYDAPKGGIGSAYWEIARDLRFWRCPIAAHIEYNGGIVDGVPGVIPNSYLAGASYPFIWGKAFMSTYLAYKYNAFEKHSDDVQWTVTWTLNLLENKLTATGFMDLWTENKNRSHEPGESGKKMVLLAQPQFWYNATPHLSLGSEVEISNNFHSGNCYVLPSLAAKWTF